MNYLNTDVIHPLYRTPLHKSQSNRSEGGRNNSIPLYLLDKSDYKNFRLQNFNTTLKKPKPREDTLQRSLKVVLLLARCLALFPVLGVDEDDPRGLHFEWFSKPMILSLIFFAYSVSIDILSVLRTIQTGLTYYNTVDFVFLASLTCTYLLFIQLASKWPKFACEWEKVERHMNAFGYSKHLGRKFKLITFTIMLLALVEHVSSIATKVVDALPCATRDKDIIKAYFVNSYKHIFSFITYTPTVAFLVAMITMSMSFAWNFIDVFIIVMSAAMTDRFKQFNQMMYSVNGKIMPATFWRTMRETYNQLSCLTKLLDELLSPIVLLSFANNLYFICLQLLNSLKPMASTWHAIYFVYSFTYLVLRTIVVSLFAAAIYDQSKQPKTVLFSVPSESYCTEVARLVNQVTSDDLALTGCRFFSVTRTLVLTVAGTIVTYEIVLVQFNAVSSDTKINTTITCLE